MIAATLIIAKPQTPTPEPPSSVIPEKSGIQSQKSTSLIGDETPSVTPNPSVRSVTVDIETSNQQINSFHSPRSSQAPCP